MFSLLKGKVSQANSSHDGAWNWVGKINIVDHDHSVTTAMTICTSVSEKLESVSVDLFRDFAMNWLPIQIIDVGWYALRTTLDKLNVPLFDAAAYQAGGQPSFPTL
jgi:hypothetical protein